MLLTALFAAALGLPASPATPPPFVGRPPTTPRALPPLSPGVDWDMRKIGSEISDGRDRGELSKRQARELRREAGEIRMLQRRYARGGLSGAEQKELRARAEMLRALTRAKRRGSLP